jgi:hypothetical protein
MSRPTLSTPSTHQRRRPASRSEPSPLRLPAAADTTLRLIGHLRVSRPSRAGAVGVADRPDVGDPPACDGEREHRHGDAVLLSDHTGLAVDRPLQERHVAGCPAGEIDQVARDLLTALDRAQRGAGQAAAVGDRGGVGVEEADQGADVLGVPCLLEVPDDAGLRGRRGRGSL